MKLAMMAGAAFAAALAMGGVARAEPLTWTWSGKVISGTGDAELFGLPNASLGGMSFSAVTVADDSVPGATRTVYNTDTYSDYNLTGDGVPGLLTTTITINGHDLSASSDGTIPGTGWASLPSLHKFHEVTGPGSQTIYSMQDYIDHLWGPDSTNASGTVINFQVASLNRALFGSADYRTPFSWTVDPLNDDLYSGDVMYHSGGSYLDLNLFPQSLTVTGGGDGSSADAALLPLGQTSDGGYIFQVPVTTGQSVYFDPQVADGYDYTLGPSSPLIASAIFPTVPGDVDGYDVYALTDLTTPLLTNVLGGASVDFTSLPGYAGGIDGFALRGIDLGANVDPNDPLAFVTQLTFASAGTVSLTQTPVTAYVAGSVPEPQTWASLSLGLAVLGGLLRRRKGAAFA
jgi:hypothetical protein